MLAQHLAHRLLLLQRQVIAAHVVVQAFQAVHQPVGQVPGRHQRLGHEIAAFRLGLAQVGIGRIHQRIVLFRLVFANLMQHLQNPHAVVRQRHILLHRVSRRIQFDPARPDHPAQQPVGPIGQRTVVDCIALFVCQLEHPVFQRRHQPVNQVLPANHQFLFVAAEHNK